MPIKPINRNSKLVAAVSSHRLTGNRVHVRKALKKKKESKRAKIPVLASYETAGSGFVSRRQVSVDWQAKPAGRYGAYAATTNDSRSFPSVPIQWERMESPRPTRGITHLFLSCEKVVRSTSYCKKMSSQNHPSPGLDRKSSHSSHFILLITIRGPGPR